MAKESARAHDDRVETRFRLLLYGVYVIGGEIRAHVLVRRLPPECVLPLEERLASNGSHRSKNRGYEMPFDDVALRSALAPVAEDASLTMVTRLCNGVSLSRLRV